MKNEMLGDIIMSIYKNLKTRVERDLRQYDIGMGQMQILMCFFSDIYATRTQNDLVKILNVDKGNISRSTAKLFEKGYIEQAPDNLKSLRLTEAGISLKADIMPIFAQISELMTAGIMSSEVSQTIKTLTKISQNLEDSI